MASKILSMNDYIVNVHGVPFLCKAYFQWHAVAMTFKTHFPGKCLPPTASDFGLFGVSVFDLR